MFSEKSRYHGDSKLQVRSIGTETSSKKFSLGKKLMSTKEMPSGQNVSLISFDWDQNELCIVRFKWKAADDNEKISVVESSSSGPND